MALTNYSPHIPIRISAPRPLNFYNTEYIKFKTTFLKKIRGFAPIHGEHYRARHVYEKPQYSAPPFLIMRL